VYRCERLRTKIEKVPAEEKGDASFPFFALGFGNFAALDDESARHQTLGGGPLPCAPLGWDDPTFGRRPTQLHLDVWASPDMEKAANLTPIETAIHAQLNVWDDGAYPESRSAFGGYSGGPVVCIGRDVTVLVAMVKQGRRGHGDSRIVATPIVEVLRLVSPGR
jgi:hypothetical protein